VVLNTSQEEWPGRWSLASAPEAEVGGILRLKPALAMKLELLGDFADAPEFIDEPTIAHGVTVGGDEVTAELTHGGGTGWSGFGTRRTYGVRRVIRGGLLQTLDPEVASVKFGLTRLHDWLQPAAFSASNTFAEFPYGAKHTLAYDEPRPLSLVTTAEFSLHAIFSAGLPFSDPRGRSNALYSFSSLRLDRTTPAPLSTFLPLVGRLRSLLSFATATQNAVTYLEAFPTRDYSQPFRKQLDPKQLLDFFPVDEVEDGELESLHPFQMLFVAADDQKQSFRTTGAWLTRWPKLGPLIHLFLSATHSQNGYQEQSFLALVQALEGFHRVTQSNNIEPRAAFRARVQEIVSSIPSEYRDLVKRALQYANEPSLRMRLNALLGIGLATVPNFMDRPDSFLKRVVATRHYFSHFAPALRAKAASSLELFSMVRVLSTLFEILVLLDLGWTVEGVRQVVERSRRNRRHRGVIRFVLEDRWGEA
jgi:hypothetical protein